MNWLSEVLTRFSEAFKWLFVLQPWEQALRVRGGRTIRKFEGGIHFRVPYLDAIFKQNCRIRVSDCGNQTLTAVCGKTVTLTSQLRYRVADVTPLYNKLHTAESTLVQMVQAVISAFVTSDELTTPHEIIQYVEETIDFEQYGLADVEFAIPDFAVVRTYRLINDGFYTYSEHTLQTDKAEGEI